MADVSAYYNENDPFAAQWLRNLITAGHIAAGDVDERSIIDVKSDEIRKYKQCHFFAGIGGWSYALRLAGWPDDRPVWTGSCPCQPFSAAGKGKGGADDRHLWPYWFNLIRECKPATVLGEQVAAAVGWGWLDAVFADLEGEGYAAGAAVLPACSVGAPHLRQRFWFVAHSQRYAAQQGRLAVQPAKGAATPASGAHAQSRRRNVPSKLGNTIKPRLEGHGGHDDNGDQPGWISTQPAGPVTQTGWADLIWLNCTDGKARPTQSGLFPLAHGIPGRVGRLRAYGNAVVPQVAETFIRAIMEYQDDC